MNISLEASSLEPTASDPQEPSAEIGSSRTPIPRTGKKDWHASGSGVRKIVTRLAAKRSTADDIGEAAIGTTSKTRRHARDNSPNTARPNIKSKRKWDMRKSSRKGKSLDPKMNVDNDWEDEAQPPNKPTEVNNEEVSSAEGKDNNNIAKQLEQEVQNLKLRCDWQEKIIEDLKSRCDSHEKVLESLRQEIVGLHERGKSLNATYFGENYDLLP
ncbi:hypothetical protein EDB87DRAFT_1573118 [Lactarius vividus]|nr:hypothetical protein EDB87DRAFT_1573118 [Lactarius vividus]